MRELSLVVALATRKEALLAGDRRSITFLGSCQELEEELYSGGIKDEAELLARANDLGATLQVSDGRKKVWKKGDLLVGEVTEISPSRERKRRVYLTPGAYLLVDIEDGRVEIKGKGSSGLVILGNRFTQSLSRDRVREAKGRVDEHLLRAIFEDVGVRTPSISLDYDLLSTKLGPKDPRSMQDPESPQDPREAKDPQSFLLAALEDDARKSGWKLCARQ